MGSIRIRKIALSWIFGKLRPSFDAEYQDEYNDTKTLILKNLSDRRDCFFTDDMYKCDIILTTQAP
jgi:hypothetical protein